MPSVKNPNKVSHNRLAARSAKVRKQRQKQAAAGQHQNNHGLTKADFTRGARPGLLPTSGPRKPKSGKQMRKLEKKMGYALKRKMEAEGEVAMKDAPENSGKKSTAGKADPDQEQMELDIS